MTPETFILILAIIGCVTVVSVISKIFSPPPGRDFAARDRDRGLAKLYEARAEVLAVEARTRRRALADQDALKRDQICEEIRDTKEKS